MRHNSMCASEHYVAEHSIPFYARLNAKLNHVYYTISICPCSLIVGAIGLGGQISMILN